MNHPLDIDSLNQEFVQHKNKNIHIFSVNDLSIGDLDLWRHWSVSRDSPIDMLGKLILAVQGWNHK